jgi:hypothetical protein
VEPTFELRGVSEFNLWIRAIKLQRDIIVRFVGAHTARNPCRIPELSDLGDRCDLESE